VEVPPMGALNVNDEVPGDQAAGLSNIISWDPGLPT